jgi:hypothetical protein
MKIVYTNESQFVTLVAASPRWVLRGEKQTISFQR